MLELILTCFLLLASFGTSSPLGLTQVQNLYSQQLNGIAGNQGVQKYNFPAPIKKLEKPNLPCKSEQILLTILTNLLNILTATLNNQNLNVRSLNEVLDLINKYIEHSSDINQDLSQLTDLYTKLNDIRNLYQSMLSNSGLIGRDLKSNYQQGYKQAFENLVETAQNALQYLSKLNSICEPEQSQDVAMVNQQANLPQNEPSKYLDFDMPQQTPSPALLEYLQSQKTNNNIMEILQNYRPGTKRYQYQNNPLKDIEVPFEYNLNNLINSNADTEYLETNFVPNNLTVLNQNTNSSFDITGAINPGGMVMGGYGITTTTDLPDKTDISSCCKQDTVTPSPIQDPSLPLKQSLKTLLSNYKSLPNTDRTRNKFLFSHLENHPQREVNDIYEVLLVKKVQQMLNPNNAKYFRNYNTNTQTDASNLNIQNYLSQNVVKSSKLLEAADFSNDNRPLNYLHYKIPISSSVVQKILGLQDNPQTKQIPGVPYNTILANVNQNMQIEYPNLNPTPETASQNLLKKYYGSLTQASFNNQKNIQINQTTSYLNGNLNLDARGVNYTVDAKTPPVNQLSGVANPPELKNSPKDLVELRYKLPMPTSYDTVVYRLPFNTFRDILKQNASLRFEPKQLHRELISKSEIEVSPQLQSLPKTDIADIVSSKGTFIDAKLVNGTNDATKDEKIDKTPNIDSNDKNFSTLMSAVQNLNSKLVLGPIREQTGNHADAEAILTGRISLQDRS